MADYDNEDDQRLFEFTSIPAYQQMVDVSMSQRELLKNQQTEVRQLDEESYGPTPRQYEYSSLPPRSIRVLKLYPYSCSRYEPPVVSLHVMSLDDSIPFDALSYTWGPPSLAAEDAAATQIFTTTDRSYPVWCGSSLLQVTKNLRDVLWRIRELHSNIKARKQFRSMFGVSLAAHVWIDELCINQADKVEQGQQVSMMGEIYRKASLVLAWLGEQEQHTRHGLELLRQLEEVMVETRDERVTSASFLDENFWRRARRKPFTKEEWCAVIDVMIRKWLTRTWVIQEVGLASKQPVCLCGTTAFPIIGIFKVAGFLLSAGWSNFISDSVQAEFAPDHFTYVRRVLAFHPFQWLQNIQHRTAQGQTYPFHLLQAYTFPSTSCYNPRDRIYATMALATEFSGPGDVAFAVNYKELPVHTYIRASKHSLERTKSLDFLSVAVHLDRGQYIEELRDLPSWCPNYSSMDFNDGRTQPIDLQPDNSRMPETFRASGGSLYVTADIATNPRFLKVKGILCETVVEVVNAQIGTEWEPLSEHIDFLSRVTPTVSTPVAEMFWRTLVHDMYSPDSADQPYPASLETRDYFFTLLYVMFNGDLVKGRHLVSPVREQLGRMASSIKRLGELDSSSNEVFPDFAPYLSLEADLLADETFWEKDGAKYPLSRNPMPAASLLWNIEAKGRSRRFFRTGDQRLGVGMQTMRAGDQVWLLSGGRVPYVLRPLENGHYEFQGEAYVHGIMMGEAWPGDQEKLLDVVLE